MVDEAQCKQCNSSAAWQLRLGVEPLLSSGGGPQVGRSGSGAKQSTAERGIRIAVKRVALSAEQIAELTIPARRD